MIGWWRNLQPRERVVVAVGALLIAALAAVQLIAAPLVAWRANSLVRAQAAQDAYRLVLRSAAIAAPARPAARTGRPVRDALVEHAAALQIELTFVNALADGSVDAQAAPVAPDRLFELFARLEAVEGVMVRSADVARTPDDANLVRAQAIFAPSTGS